MPSGGCTTPSTHSVMRLNYNDLFTFHGLTKLKKNLVVREMSIFSTLVHVAFRLVPDTNFSIILLIKWIRDYN